VIDCPTCKGTGKVEAPPSPEFRPGLAEALHRSRHGVGISQPERQCTLCIVIEYAMPGEAKDALVEAAAGRLSAMALRTSLRSIGVGIARDTIFKHRNEAHRP